MDRCEGLCERAQEPDPVEADFTLRTTDLETAATRHPALVADVRSRRGILVSWSTEGGGREGMPLWPGGAVELDTTAPTISRKLFRARLRESEVVANPSVILFGCGGEDRSDREGPHAGA